MSKKDMVTSLIETAAAAAKSLQLCPTLHDPIDCSPPGSPVPGILKARILEWVLSLSKKKKNCYLFWRGKCCRSSHMILHRLFNTLKYYLLIFKMRIGKFAIFIIELL